MHYLTLRAEGFRNLADLELNFHPRVNWVYGPNGQGKTNLLESMLWLVSGRSQRGARDDDMIRFGSEHFFLAGTLADEGAEELRFQSSFERGGRKRIRLNGEEVARLSELVGLTGTVVFGPGDVAIVTGEPERRRSFLDYTLSKTDPSYLRELIRYKRVLKQRNALLKSHYPNRNHLGVWTDRLIESGSRIINSRRQNIGQLSASTAEFYGEIGGGREPLELSYMSPVEGTSEAELAASLRSRLELAEASELLKKRTLEGPHRDDMSIDINAHNARKFASQGQKRSAAVALKLAQAEYLARIRRDPPIVFLDDVFSELDEARRERLCQLVGKNYQSFLATPYPGDMRPNLFAEMQRFRVEAGRITPERDQ